MVDPQKGPQAPHLDVQATEVEDAQDMAIEDLVVVIPIVEVGIVVLTKAMIELLMAETIQEALLL